MDWFKELFIDEAKKALVKQSASSGGSDGSGSSGGGITSWNDLTDKPFSVELEPLSELESTVTAGSTALGTLGGIGYLGTDRKKHLHENGVFLIRIGEEEVSLDYDKLSAFISDSPGVLGQYNGINLYGVVRIHSQTKVWSIEVSLTSALSEDVSVYLCYGLEKEKLNIDYLPEHTHDIDDIPETIATKSYVEELIEANTIDTETIATKSYVEELIGGIENGSY